MKLSTLSIVALLCSALAGPGSAQTTADSYRKAGAAYFNENSAGLPTSGNGAPIAAPAHAVILYAQNTTPQARPQPSAANGLLTHKVGERVDYVYNGVWYSAVIIKVRDDSAEHLDGKLYSPYRVHPLGDNGNTDTWVCCADFTDHRSQLNRAGPHPTEPVPGGEANDDVLKAMSGATAAKPPQPVAKRYECGVAAPITITGNSTYIDSEGKRGTFSFDSASSTVAFHGGNYDGQRAAYETSGGLAQLHILGPSGRPVIDCD